MNLSFRTVSESAVNEDDQRANPIQLAKERLLSLEAAIERRYLKAPLGHRSSSFSLKKKIIIFKKYFFFI